MSGPLVYIEYISRRPGVSLEAFHALAGHGQTGWAGDNPEEILLANLGRTLADRAGARVPRLLVHAGAGTRPLRRLGADLPLGRGRRVRGAVQDRRPHRRGGLLRPADRAQAGRSRAGLHRVLRHRAGSDSRRRAARPTRSGADGHPELKLNFVLDRIGRLGPDPRGLAAWGLAVLGPPGGDRPRPRRRRIRRSGW